MKAKLKEMLGKIFSSKKSNEEKKQAEAQAAFDALPPRDQAIEILVNGRNVSGALRRRALRAMATPVPEFRVNTHGKPAVNAVDAKDVRRGLMERFGQKSWAQLNKWRRRVSRRLPFINQCLEDAKAEGMVLETNLLQVKSDRMTTLLSALDAAITVRKFRSANKN